MKKHISIWVLLLISLGALAQSNSEKFIEVSAEATKKVTANKIVCTLSFTKANNNNNGWGYQNNCDPKATFDSTCTKWISKLGLSEDEISESPYNNNNSFNVYQQYTKSYVINLNSYDDFIAIKKQIDQRRLQGTYINFNITSALLTENLKVKIEDELIEKAMSMAKEKAGKILKSIGSKVKLNTPYQITEEPDYTAYNYYNLNKDLTLRKSVRLRYYLE